MKLFNPIFQRKILNIILTIYTIVTALYLIIPLLYTPTHETTITDYASMILVVFVIVLLIFQNSISNSLKTYFVASILIVTGLLENFFLESYKGYFFCIMAFLVTSLMLKKKVVFVFWFLAIISLVAIGILKFNGILESPYSDSLIQVSKTEWLERMVIYTLLTGAITWALSTLQGFINHLIHTTNQEKIKYQPLFNQTHSFISILNKEGKIIESNESALYYIQSRKEEVANIYFPETKWWDHSEDVKKKVEHNLKASISGDFRRFEATHLNKDNVLEHFDYTLKPIFEKNFNIEFIIAEGRNISNIKKAQETIHEGEERLLALTESSYEGLLITHNGSIVEANQSIMKLLLIDNQEDIIGKHIIQDFIHPNEHNLVNEKNNNKITKAYETRAIRTDGVVIPIEIEGRDIVYKGVKHRLSAIRDLTERRLAQEALVNSEEKYRLITENINDIICKLDENLRFTYASSSVYNMLGYTVSEMENISIKDITTRDSYLTIISNFNHKKKLIKMNTTNVWSGVSFEAILKHKSGTLLWTLINAKLIKWGKDNSYEILCIARNIDVIKKFQFTLEKNENRLKQQNEGYERLNLELTNLNDKLIQAKDKAEESDKLKSAFLANMSHEIRTPMNSIIGFSKMYKNSDIDQEKRNRFADFVVNNGNLLLNIVNDVLDLSKIESGQIKLKKETFNLNELIENIYADLVSKNRKGLMIVRTKELDDIDSFIFGDPVRITQILTNLTNNAYKFTKKGAIKFGYRLLNQSIIFYIEDTGIGIPLALQEKIFERFRQVELDASRVFGGAGLGLSISKKMVELMKGKIWLRSESGHGSTFYVSIPYEITIDQVKKSIPKTITNKKMKTDSTITILIAEDDESNFFYLNELLIDYNCKVIRAKNGSEAVEHCFSNDAIELVFMDIKMPVMDGFEATKIIKNKKPNLPIVAQTAFAMSDDKKTALANGCDDYISKPIDPDIFFSMIEKYSIS